MRLPPELAPGHWRMVMLSGRSFAIALLAAMAMADIGYAQDAAKYPDWSGQRRRAETGPPRYDSTKPPGHGQQAPLTPEYRAIHEASIADQAAGGQGGD